MSFTLKLKPGHTLADVDNVRLDAVSSYVRVFARWDSNCWNVSSIAFYISLLFAPEPVWKVWLLNLLLLHASWSYYVSSSGESLFMMSCLYSLNWTEEPWNAVRNRHQHNVKTELKWRKSSGNRWMWVSECVQTEGDYMTAHFQHGRHPVRLFTGTKVGTKCKSKLCALLSEPFRMWISLFSHWIERWWDFEHRTSRLRLSFQKHYGCSLTLLWCLWPQN